RVVTTRLLANCVGFSVVRQKSIKLPSDEPALTGAGSFRTLVGGLPPCEYSQTQNAAASPSPYCSTTRPSSSSNSLKSLSQYDSTWFSVSSIGSLPGGTIQVWIGHVSATTRTLTDTFSHGRSSCFCGMTVTMGSACSTVYAFQSRGAPSSDACRTPIAESPALLICA